MKRQVNCGDGDDAPDPKRPNVSSLASEIVEALKVDLLPILRQVVREEVERVVKFETARLGGGSSPKRIEKPDGRNLRLCFRSRLSLHLFTGGKVKGEQGAAIDVVLLDVNTGHVVKSGPEAYAKLDVVVLQGDFNNEDDDDWTAEDFESHIVKEREGKGPLLTGDIQVSLKEGVGTLGELTFTDNSSWTRSKKFRLGMKIATGFCDRIRFREAKTEAFAVKEHRVESNRKHYPPALKDKVWRLEKIGKDGPFHKRLNEAGIEMVEDFCRLVVRDSQRLRNILGNGMSNKMWDSLVEHSKTCVLSEKFYIYYSDDTRVLGAIFNDIYEFSGLIDGGQFYSPEFLNNIQKESAGILVKNAYDNRMHFIEYDGPAPFISKQNKETTSHNDIPSVPYDQQVPLQHPHGADQQVPLQHPHVTVPLEEFSDGMLAHAGGSVSTAYNHPHSSASDPNIQFKSPCFARQDQLVGSSHQTHITRNDSTGAALSPPQQISLISPSMAHNIQTPNLHTLDGWFPRVDANFTEEQIRELCAGETSSNLTEDWYAFPSCMSSPFPDFNFQEHRSAGETSANLAEDWYAFPSCMPSPFPDFNFQEHRSKTSDKAVVGWLKIKAVMRWGIFVRKKAAEKRPSLLSWKKVVLQELSL